MTLKLDVRSGVYLIWLVLLLFLLGGLVSKERGIPKVREVRRIKVQLVEEIHQLEESNKNLEAEIVSLRTDPFWTEKIAREELNMVKPGEIVLKFRE